MTQISIPQFWMQPASAIGKPTAVFGTTASTSTRNPAANQLASETQFSPWYLWLLGWALVYGIGLFSLFRTESRRNRWVKPGKGSTAIKSQTRRIKPSQGQERMTVNSQTDSQPLHSRSQTSVSVADREQPQSVKPPIAAKAPTPSPKSSISQPKTASATAKWLDAGQNQIQQSQIQHNQIQQNQTQKSQTSISSKLNNLDSIAVGSLPAIRAATGEAYSYTLLDSAGDRFVLKGSELHIPVAALHKVQININYTVTVRRVTADGNHTDKSFMIRLTPEMLQQANSTQDNVKQQ
jgi:hypothetical protein